MAMVNDDSATPNDLFIAPVQVLGLTPTVKGNGVFVDSSSILYVCEKSLVKYDMTEKRGHVEINTLSKSRKIDAFCINQTRSMVCLGQSREDSVLSLYEEEEGGFHKRRMIQLADGGPNSGTVVWVDFSAKSNFLGMIVAHPHRLCIFSLERNVIVLNLRFTHFHRRHTRELTQVHFNPLNEKVFLLVGEGVLRTIRIKIVVKSGDWEVRFKTMGFYQAKHMTIMSACWCDEDRVLAGTKDGRLLVIENCEIKGIYFVTNLAEFFIPKRSPNIKVRETVNWTKLAQKELEEFEYYSLRQITSFERGFVIANDRLLLFEEPLDRPRWFRRIKVFDFETGSSTLFLNMHSSKLQRLVTCCTQSNSIYFVDLNKPEDKINPVQLENISADENCIESLSTCLWKPICLSLSGKTICLFNYNTSEIINKWTFSYKGKNVSLNPTGSLFCLTLQRYLCIFQINHDHKFSHRFRSCKLILQVAYQESFSHCVFSDGGACFGGSTKLRIYVYSSTTYQILAVFEVHSVMLFSQIDDDRKTMTSMSGSGVTIRHDLQTGRVLWRCQTTCREPCLEFADSKPQRCVYITHSNGSLTKIVYSSGNMFQTNFSLTHEKLTGIAISQTSGRIFFGTDKGTILQMKPLDLEKYDVEAISYKEYPVQSHAITKMIVTPTNKLVTGNKEGSICVYNFEGGPELVDYVCPHKTTNFLIGSFSLLKFITSVRKMNEKTLNDWFAIKEFMVNEKFVNWAGENSTAMLKQMEEVEAKLRDIHELRNYYKRIWSEMDSFWEPQESRHEDICNNYLYYNTQFRSKDNMRYDGWTRGLWHIRHIDTASRALCSVLDETLSDVFKKKTIEERYIQEYNEILESQVKQMDEVKGKVEKACQVYMKLYTTARNTYNGLQHFILQEGNVDPAKEFDKKLHKKNFFTFIVPYQEDIKILDKIYQRCLHEAYIRGKEVFELSCFENGPTGVTKKLLPNLMTSEYEIMKSDKAKQDSLIKYLRSLPTQWREIRRWDWLIHESNEEYQKWFLQGQGHFCDAFYNSHAFHELREEEMMKHLHKKQLSMIHNCSSNYVEISRSLKFVNMFYYNCIKMQNKVEMELHEINKNLETYTKEDLFSKLLDLYNILNKPNKIREDEFRLRRLTKTKIKKHKLQTSITEFCPRAPFLINCPTADLRGKTESFFYNNRCYC